ncbi:MAG: hypothetical protein MIO92_14220 [Methanosarcinaceae archaeon]|nr:hypothetical protein [Methanosarcinaceae archaeon]
MICTAVTKNKQPCLNTAVHESDPPRCLFHATHDELEAATKRQNEKFDIKTELKKELRRAQKARGNSLDKAKTALEILKLIKECEGGKSEPVEKKDETPQEYARRLRGK